MAAQQPGVQVQPVAMHAQMPQRKGMSIWWPMSFLILWVVFSALGGGLLGGGLAAAAQTYDNDYYDYEYNDSGANSMWIGGIACLAISGVLGLVFWILFIVWLVKRAHRGPTQPSIVYTNQPPMAYQPPHQQPHHQQSNQPNIVYTNQPYQQQYFPSQPTPQPQQHQQPQPPPQQGYPTFHQPQPTYATRQAPAIEHHHQSEPSVNSSSIVYPGSPGVENSRPANHCGSCGSAVTTPFCPQCGNRV